MGCVVALVAAIGAPLVAAQPAVAAVQCGGSPATIVGTEGSDTLSGSLGGFAA